MTENQSNGHTWRWPVNVVNPKYTRIIYHSYGDSALVYNPAYRAGSRSSAWAENHCPARYCVISVLLLVCGIYCGCFVSNYTHYLCVNAEITGKSLFFGKCVTCVHASHKDAQESLYINLTPTPPLSKQPTQRRGAQIRGFFQYFFNCQDLARGSDFQIVFKNNILDAFGEWKNNHIFSLSEIWGSSKSPGPVLDTAVFCNNVITLF